MNWFQEQIDELMRLYRQGLTSYQMAAHFGVTRNAICGRIHRERVKQGAIEAKPRNRKPSQRRRRDDMLTLPVRAEFMLSAYKVPDPRIPDEGQLASIVDVTGCKWPVRDDAEFVGGVAFCNHAVEGDKSYCPYHAQINVASFSRSLIRKTIKSALHLVKEKAA